MKSLKSKRKSVKRVSPPPVSCSPSPIDGKRSLAQRAAAFHAARAAYERINGCHLDIKHSEDLLHALRSSLVLLEHLIAFWRERADLARPDLRQALKELQLADEQCHDAGAKMLKEYELGEDSGCGPLASPRFLNDLMEASEA